MSEQMPNSITVDEGVGAVSFADEVIGIIAGLAVNEVPGVAGMTGNFTSGIQEILGMKNLSKGVKVEVGKEEAAIDVYCILEYGQSIIDVAKAVQENVRKAVETMTGLHVVECNVHVQGIQFEKEMPPVQSAEEEIPQEAIEPRVK